jgi:hypothetical protein
LGDAEEFGHFVVEEALAGFVGLDPFAVEDKLGDAAFAGLGDDGVGGSGDAFDVDFGVGDFVLGEEALGLAAVAAPVGGINEKLHRGIISHLDAEGGYLGGIQPEEVICQSQFWSIKFC